MSRVVRTILGIVTFLFIVGLCSISYSMEISPGLEKTVLSNGLTAIVKASHRAPVVAVQVWVKAGSRYETDKEAGITHLIEHMIFNGTKKRGPGVIAKTIESIGGTINAYTSLDYTVYHCQVPKQYLDTALDVLSDAVFHSVFAPNELKKEKKVVLEEMRMRNDMPESCLENLLMKISYKVYPYRRPVIGYPNTVKSITRKDILAYVAKRYRPCQMAVVVVGDVDPTQALTQIQKYFGSQPKKPPVKVNFPKEPPQTQVRVAINHMDIYDGYLAISFSGGPSFNSKDTPVLDVIAALLSDGASSRLVHILRDKLQLVQSIDAYSFTPAGPGLFEITATLDPQNTDQAISEILKQIYRLKYNQVLNEELQRAKVQVESEFIYDQETMSGEAQKLGVFQTLAGDPGAVQKYLKAVESVTAADIMRVANKLFKDSNINIAMELPDNVTVDITPQRLVPIIQDAELEAQGVQSSSNNSIVYPIRRLVLSNGLTLLMKRTPGVPAVAVRLVLPGGLRCETPKDNGIFAYLAQVWPRGTTEHSAQGLAEAVSELGGSISGFSGMNTFGLRGQFLSSTFSKGLKLFAEVALDPTFSPDEVNKVRPIMLARLKRQEDNLPAVAMLEFRRLLFSPHPYSMNPLGTKEVIEKITAKDLKKIYTQYVVPDRAVLAIVGDINVDKVIAEVKELFGNWTVSNETPLPTPPAPAPLNSPKCVSLSRNAQQVQIVLGFRGVTFTSQDRWPLEVLDALLSGQGGRLFEDIRDKQGLCYEVTSILGLGVDYGYFAFYVATTPQNQDRVIKALWQDIYGVVQAPVTQQELNRAKKWLIGTHEIALQTNDAQALSMALDEIYGLGYDFEARYPEKIQNVTAAMVQQVAQKILNTNGYVLVQVGPQQ